MARPAAKHQIKRCPMPAAGCRGGAGCQPGVAAGGACRAVRCRGGRQERGAHAGGPGDGHPQGARLRGQGRRCAMWMGIKVVS